MCLESKCVKTVITHELNPVSQAVKHVQIRIHPCQSVLDPVLEIFDSLQICLLIFTGMIDLIIADCGSFGFSGVLIDQTAILHQHDNLFPE